MGLFFTISFFFLLFQKYQILFFTIYIIHYTGLVDSTSEFMQETATPQECVLPKPRLLSDIETMLAAREHESIEDIVAEMAAIDKLKNQVKQMRPTSTKIIQTYRKKIKKIQQTAETTRAAGRQKAHKGDYEAGKKASSAAAEMLREATGLEHDIVKLQVDIRIKEDDAIELNRNLQSVLVLNIRREEEMVRLAAKVHEYVELEEYGSAKALDLLMKEYGTVGEQITNLAVWKKKKSDEYDKKMAIQILQAKLPLVASKEFNRLSEVRNSLPLIHGKRDASGSSLKSVNASISDINSLINILGSLVERHKELLDKYGE